MSVKEQTDQREVKILPVYILMAWMPTLISKVAIRVSAYIFHAEIKGPVSKKIAQCRKNVVSNNNSMV